MRFIGNKLDRRTLKHGCILSSIFALNSALGNGTIMLIICKTRELRSPSLTLLFSLAVADLLVGFVWPAIFRCFQDSGASRKFQSVLYVENYSVFFWVDNLCCFFYNSKRNLHRQTSCSNSSFAIPKHCHSSKGGDSDYCGLSVLLGLDSFKDLAWSQMDHSSHYHNSCGNAAYCILHI